ncbi:hypothetical protein TeGR_g5129, partial [Tetraparma gracilis]
HLWSTAPELLEVLSESEAARFASLVKKNRDRWIQMDERAGPLPAFTYGTYWMYLTFSKSWPDRLSMQQNRHRRRSITEVVPAGTALTTSAVVYEEAVKHYNSALREDFQDVYDGVRKTLEERLGKEVVFAADQFKDPTGLRELQETEWALPGFNVQLHHRIFQEEVFQAHVDGSGSPISAQFPRGSCQ